MKRRISYGLLVAILGLNLFLGGQIYFRSVQAADKDDIYPNLKLFSVVLDRVRNDYVDGEKLSYQELIYGALKGMLNTLDPHSEFMEPVKYDELKKDTQGEFGGIGIQIAMKDNFVTVIAPMEGEPAYRAGILTGDRIVKIDGRSTERFGLQDAVKKLRGEPGSKVTVGILRPATGKTLEFELTRAVVKVDTIKDINGHGLKDPAAFALSENNVGYIRLVQFGEQTASDLEDGLKRLEIKGVQSLILDLRGNPGGLLDQAVKVCEKFLPRGQLIVSTEGRGTTPKSQYTASGRDKHADLPIVILVNGGSASASEIVAGCLQDATRLGVCKALVLGEQTFGKGSVQSILPLQDGSALRLTTAKYYTPSHKVIHEKGVTPDIFVAMSDEEERDLFLKRSPGGLEAADPKDQDRIRNARDPQLDRALDQLKGISLFIKRAGNGEKMAKKFDKAEAK